MKKYDRNLPLIYSHIPKTGGISVRRIFNKWFGANVLLHYRNGGVDLPPHHDLVNPPDHGKPILIYGHFNRDRGFGIDTYYPEVTQCVTILREPWERVISAYFFKKQHAERFPDFHAVAAMDLEEYLSKWPFDHPDFSPPMTSFMPKGCDLTNYTEMLDSYFIEIGIMEKLEESMGRISTKLGMDFESSDLLHLNVSNYTRDIPLELKQEFVRRNPVEYAIYDYVRARYE
jgi:hypothetical protein